jgi:hypothetical protein
MVSRSKIRVTEKRECRQTNERIYEVGAGTTESTYAGCLVSIVLRDDGSLSVGVYNRDRLTVGVAK